MNFYGATKGNPGPAGFVGVIKNSDRKILIFFWGGIGIKTSNMVELEGLVSGIKWDIKQ